MTKRTRELLLELMLLRERYSDADIRSLSQQLKDLPHGSQIKALIDAMNSLEIGEKKTISPRKSGILKSSSFDKEALIKSLMTNAKYKNPKRISELSQKFGTKLIIGDISASIKNIIEKVQIMSDEEVYVILEKRQNHEKVDEGYLGLADYLIHQKKN